MYDVSGNNWLKHILWGTSCMLKARGPGVYRHGLERRFFLEVRIFEVLRSLIFLSPSFLIEYQWRQLVDDIWAGEFARDWHPKETLLDLMLSCSDLGVR